MKALLVALVVALTSAAAVVTDVVVDRPAPAAAAPAGDDEVIAFLVRGVGNGHGRGLSQWGSYGRAIAGQGWEYILDAYYGGTTKGTVPTDQMIGVRLLAMDGVSNVGVISTTNSAQWVGASGNWSSSSRSIRVEAVGGNRFNVYTSTTQTCATGLPEGPLAQGSTGDDVRRVQQFLLDAGYSPGPADGQFGPMTAAALIAWQNGQGLPADGVWNSDDAARARQQVGGGGANTLVAQNVVGPMRLRAATAPANPGEALGLCQPTGAVVHYRNEVRVHDTSSGTRTVSYLRVEDYLRGVVPKESPASWGDDNGFAGLNALRAQAVAARSYGISQNRGYWVDAAQTARYATTCDSPSCQVYGGAATRAFATSTVYSPVEHEYTDRAVAETAGVVRKQGSTVVSTEFSASNGPRTAGGNYPAVDDPWDDVAGNPNHRWTRVIDADSLRTRYGLASANGVVTAHDADSLFDGIWANEVRLGDGRTVTAWDFRNAYGLPAPGFELVPIRRSMSNALDFAFIGDSVGESVAGSPTSTFRVLTEGVFSSERWDAISSRRTQGGSIPDGVGAAQQVPIGTDLVVVELGYNDTPSQMPAEIDALMSALRARQVGIVLWVNVSERRSLYTETNAALRAAETRWSELRILDWESASDHEAAHRWFSDDVHLTSTGRAEFSIWLRDRIIDLVADGYVPPRQVVPGRPLHVPVLGQGGVPETGVAGVALNVTVARPAAAGYVRVWPCASPEPDTSSVNFLSAGAVEPNAVIVPVDESGEVCVSTLVASDVIVDVTGWFDSGVAMAAGRLVDTRQTGARLAAGATMRVPVLGAAGVPTDGVAGVALNVTAVRTARAGYLRVWPCGLDEPDTSSVNYVTANAVEPNAVVVPVDETGEVCVSSLVASDVIVDVTGWFDGGIRSAAGRLLDTRDSGQRLAKGTTLRVRVVDVAGVPATGVAGVALNLTAVNPVAAGYLRAWPCNSSEPETSSVNYQRAGAIEPNAVVVPVDDSGEVCISSLVDSHVVVDVTAWFDSGLRPSPGARIVDTRSGLGPVPPR